MNNCIHPLIGLEIKEITYHRDAIEFDGAYFGDKITITITYFCPVCGERFEVTHEHTKDI